MIVGIGIIDFEHWRPIWRQNWMSLAVYKNYSRVVERRKHPRWKKQDIEVEVGSKKTASFDSLLLLYLVDYLSLLRFGKTMWFISLKIYMKRTRVFHY